MSDENRIATNAALLRLSKNEYRESGWHSDALFVKDYVSTIETEINTLREERDNYKRAVDNAHNAIDLSGILLPQDKSHQGLTPRIKSLCARHAEMRSEVERLVAFKDKLIIQNKKNWEQQDAWRNRCLAAERALEEARKDSDRVELLERIAIFSSLDDGRWTTSFVHPALDTDAYEKPSVRAALDAAKGGEP